MAEPIDEVTKSPRAELWYGFDLATLGWLDSGDTLVSGAWTEQIASGTEGEDPEDELTIADSTIDVDAGQTLVKLTGGTDGVDYLVTCLFETQQGDVDERSFALRCRNR